MNPLVQTFLLFGITLSAGSLAMAAVELRRIRTFISSWTFNVQAGPSWRSPSAKLTILSSPAGYAIFVYRNKNWVLEADLSNPGYEAVPPTIPGSYEGQVVKKESVLMTTL
ncbi:MAG: hypothetical protein HY290_25560 [Planctomycetia bacterium]|nr:hypothetical protein [Planctomycetia bacterium]